MAAALDCRLASSELKNKNSPSALLLRIHSPSTVFHEPAGGAALSVASQEAKAAATLSDDIIPFTPRRQLAMVKNPETVQRALEKGSKGSRDALGWHHPLHSAAAGSTRGRTTSSSTGY